MNRFTEYFLQLRQVLIDEHTDKNAFRITVIDLLSMLDIPNLYQRFTCKIFRYKLVKIPDLRCFGALDIVDFVNDKI